MKNRLLRCIVFTAIPLCIVYIFGFVFLPKNNNHYAGVHDYDLSAFGILAEREDSLDVLFIGDSEAYCAFIPLRIWELYGIPSYVVSTVDQQTFETEELLHMALQQQKPKVVILETNALYRGASRADAIKNSISGALPLLRYHDRWKSLHWNDWFSKPNYTDADDKKGYNLKSKIEPADTWNYMEPTDEIEELPSGNVRRLRSMRDYCWKQGAELWLVSSPSTLNWDCWRHNAVEELAEELRIPYFDLNMTDGVLDIDWDRDTMDEGDHMNYYGAVKVSDYIGEILKQTGAFPDKREIPEYQEWNLLLEPFRNACIGKGLEVQ